MTITNVPTMYLDEKAGLLDREVQRVKNQAENGADQTDSLKQIEHLALVISREARGWIDTASRPRWIVTVTDPDGETSKYEFTDKGEAHEYAESYFMNMDTAEARETSVQVKVQPNDPRLVRLKEIIEEEE